MTAARKIFRMILILGLFFMAAPAAPIARAGEISLDEARRRLREETEDANSLFSLSFYFEGVGRPFSALRSVERAIEVDPKVAGYHARRGQLLMSRRRIRESAVAYGKAAGMEPETKSFRAAEARALSACHMFEKAAGSWKILLDGADGGKEVLDAARNLSATHRKLANLAGAESAWLTALGKLDDWNERMQAADQASAAMLAQGAPGRAVEFWAGIFEEEKDWNHRTALAGRVFGVARRPSAESAELLARSAGVWQKLLTEAGEGAEKREAAASLAEVMLASGKPDEAVEVLRPYLFKEEWSVSYGIAATLDRAYSRLGKTDERDKLWREMLKQARKCDYAQMATGQLVAVLDDADEIIRLHRALVASYPDEINARQNLAGALARAEKYAEAVKIYEETLPLVRKQKHYDVSSEYHYWQSMITWCAQGGQLDRAVEFMKNRFSAVRDPWQVTYWLSSINSQEGEYAALNATGELVACGGVRRLGAGQYLNNYLGRQDEARPVLEAAAGDTALTAELRQQALNLLMNMARTGAERVEIARRMVALGGSYWQKRNSYSQLASWLARQGEIVEGVAVVRKAEGVRQNRSSAGPDTLRSLGGNIFAGNRVGPGLRTDEGQAAAEGAAEGLYRDFSARQEYRYNMESLLRNLAELHARRGDYDGAVGFLHRMAEVRDTVFIRLAAAGILDRRDEKDKNAALAEYLAYVDVLARDHYKAIGDPKLKRRGHWLPGLDGTCLYFLEANDKDEDFIEHVDGKLKKTDGRERMASADILIQFYRQRARPEDVRKLIARLKGMGLNDTFYRQQDECAVAAIRMKNSSSQADTVRRDRLLKAAESWKSTLAKNPEDYQAAVNAYKVYVLLGRKADGDPYIEKALAACPGDPMILELCGRELMLEKSYASAAAKFVEAARITGRRTDYEESICGAFELAGKHKEAITLSLDSLRQGWNSGRGIRSVEQILDVAERSDKTDFLHEELKKLVAAEAEAGRPLGNEMVRLALRVAWEQNDDELGKAAVDELLRTVRDPSRSWQEDWRLTQLAQRAAERRRLDQAAGIRRALIELRASQGYSPQVHEYRQLAMLMIENGQPEAAAGLMFDGLDRAGQGGAAPRPGPIHWERGGIRAPHPGPKPVPASRDVRLPWISAILEMAAIEAGAGGGEFRKACGDGLTALVEDEMKVLEAGPAVYSGPLVNSVVAEGLEMRERISAAFRAAAAADKAETRDHLALARRLVNMAAMPKDKRPAELKLDDIIASCRAAVGAAGEEKKGKTLLECARLYGRLLAVNEKERLDGVEPTLALEAYEAAAAARSGKWGLDALREALNLAKAHKVPEKALAYAQRLHRDFPRDSRMRYALAEALLADGQVEEAIATLRSGLEDNSAYTDYRRAGETCMTARDKPQPQAAAGAVDFYSDAIAAYLKEVGKQVDAEGQPLPDRELGTMQSQLSAAHAAEGRPEKSLEALLASTFNLGGSPFNPASVETVAEAYAKAGKADELAAELAAEVKADPRNIELRLAQGAALAKLEKFAEAAAAFRAAKVLRPDLATVKRLVTVLRSAKLHKDALEECRSWAASFPRDAEAYRAMAGVYKDLKDEKGELRALTMLVEVAPREAANCRQVAVIFAERKEYPRAIGLMERALELRPEEPHRHIDLAEVLFMSGENERAGKICREALERDWEKGLAPELLARLPDWRGTYETRTHSLLGDIYQAAEQPGEAAKARLNVPADYKRPALKDAVPTPRPRWWGRWPRPMPMGMRGRMPMIEEG